MCDAPLSGWKFHLSKDYEITHGSVIFYGRFSNHHQICWSRADEAYIYPIQSKICHIHARYFAHCLLGTDRHTPNIGDLTGMFLYIGKHESFLQ